MMARFDQVIIIDFGEGPKPQPNLRAAEEAVAAKKPTQILCAYRDQHGKLHHVTQREVYGRDPVQTLNAALEATRELASKAARRGDHLRKSQPVQATRSGGASSRAHGLW